MIAINHIWIIFSIFLIDVEYFNGYVICDRVATITTIKPTTSIRAHHSVYNYTTSYTTDVPNASPSRKNGTRTLQRLVGGHLHHAVYRKPDEPTATETSKLSKIYFRRKRPLVFKVTTTAPVNVSSYSTRTNTLLRSYKSRSKPISATQDDELSDAKLLSDDSDVTNDVDGVELERASAGNGKETDGGKSSKKDDSKKTLSDQVKEGKYGLIQTEIFHKEPKRPGIISYLSNPDVPKDTVENLGGLDADDIWLAEDHLLVLKGGSLSKENSNEPWKPIDDYEAPPRQVKIPENPKIPPPFLVQLEDNGPIQFIGPNKIPLINPFTNESLLLFPDHGTGYPKTETYTQNKTNLFARPRPIDSTKNDDSPGYQYPSPYPPFPSNNETFVNPFLHMSPPFPFPPPFGRPNGSLENSNVTDYFDEDDPSLYYPPPYSFVYKSNYTNPVPPGPLVPGIVLPPPVNFFGRLGDPVTTTTKPITTSTQPLKYKSTTSRPYKQIVRPAYRQKTTTIRPYLGRIKDVLPLRTKPITSTSSTTTTTTTTTTVKPTVKLEPIPEIISFISKDALPDQLDSNPAHPIYYEYFDATAGNQHSDRQQIVNDDGYRKKPDYRLKPITSSAKPPVYYKNRPASTQLRLQKPYYQYLPEKYVYASPEIKPEIKPNGLSNNVLNGPVDQSETFNKEIETIRQTLQFYKRAKSNLKSQGNYDADPVEIVTAARLPKAKAVYEYSFDSSSPDGSDERLKQFNPPVLFDTTPFKPMVNYSPPINGNNDDEFQAMPAHTTTTEPVGRYYSTERPVTDVDNNNYPTQLEGHREKSGRHYSHKTTSPKYIYYEDQQTKRPQKLYYNRGFGEKIVTTTPNAITDRPQWISIEKQIVQEIYPKDGGNRSPNLHRGGYIPYDPAVLSAPSVTSGPQNPFNILFNYNSEPNYYSPVGYQTVKQPVRQLNGYNPQQQPERFQPINLVNDTAVNYIDPRPAINPDAELIDINNPTVFNRPSYNQQYEAIRNQINAYPQSQPQRYQPISYVNDTAVNYLNPRPPINPDAEIIDVSNPSPYNPNTYRRYGPIRFPNQQSQQSPSNHRYYIQPTKSGQLTNNLRMTYNYPMAPIEPAAEWVYPRSETGHQAIGGRYEQQRRHPQVVQYKLPGDQQTGVYFITPQESRYN